MRVFIATLGAETNTFTPMPTGLAEFVEYELFDGDGSRRPPIWGNVPLIQWRALAEADGHEVIESLCAFAQPGGPLPQGVYRHLRDRILADLEHSRPHLVLLNLHGAMVAEGEDDCEGDLLARARAIVGPTTPILAELDLHALLSARMVASADLLLSYKEYPHTDLADRARDLYRLGMRIAHGEVRPTPAVAPAGLLLKLRPTHAPMRAFVDRLYALEASGEALAASLIHSFPFADAADVGAKALIYTDAAPARAAELAQGLARDLWAMREGLLTPYLGIEEAIDVALAGPGLSVVADPADNTGSGAPGDSTFILARLIERGVEGAALGGLWDPMAVRIAASGGLGARLPLRLGGKSGPTSGPPLDVTAQVMGLAERHEQSGLSGGRQFMGPSAWLRLGGIDVIVVSHRVQTLATDLFTGLGCTLDDKRVIVVKSAQHFQAAFAPIAARVIYCAAPGASPPDHRVLPYRKAPPLWPIVEPEAGQC